MKEKLLMTQELEQKPMFLLNEKDVYTNSFSNRYCDSLELHSYLTDRKNKEKTNWLIPQLADLEELVDFFSNEERTDISRLTDTINHIINSESFYVSSDTQEFN